AQHHRARAEAIREISGHERAKAHDDPVEERDAAHARAGPSEGVLERLEKDGEAEERADGHRDDDEGRAQHDPAAHYAPSVGRAVAHEVSILPSRTGIKRHMFAAMATPSPAQGTAKPPRRSAARPNMGGQIVTPKEEMASPSPMAVPAPRGPTSSAI